jgi:hypothetical protein
MDNLCEIGLIIKNQTLWQLGSLCEIRFSSWYGVVGNSLLLVINTDAISHLYFS